MKRLTLSDFSKGIIRDVNPERVPNEALYDALNYEYRGVEGLARRYGVEEYDDLNWIIFRFALTGIKAIAVWYPSVMPANAKVGADKIYAIHAGNSVGVYYYTSGSGGTDPAQTIVLDNAGSSVAFAQSPTRFYITDGAHPIQQVLLTTKKELIYGQVGLDRPRSIPSVSLAGDDNFYVEYTADDKGMGIERGNILQYCYTVEDRYGAESAPSPIVTESRLMWKYPYAEGTEGFRYYWYRAKLLGLSTAQYPGSIMSRIKYINVYRRDIPFLSGTIPTAFSLVKRIPATGTDVYVDTSGDNLKDIDYGAGVAPAASSIALTGGVIFASADPDRPVTFPFVFDEYLIIKIDNDNDLNYANAVVAFKVPWAVAGEYDLSSVLYDIQSNLDKVRLYFQDAITPCPVLFKNYGENTLVITRLPYLDRNQVTTLYLCVATDSAGVDDPSHQNVASGRFGLLSTDISLSNQVFLPPQVASAEQKVLSYYVGEWYNDSEDNILPNKANDLYHGECSTGRTITSERFPGYNTRIMGRLYGVRTIASTLFNALLAAPDYHGGSWRYRAFLERDFCLFTCFILRGQNDAPYKLYSIAEWDTPTTSQGFRVKVLAEYMEFRWCDNITPQGIAPGTDYQILPEKLGLGAFTSNQEFFISVLWQDSGCWARVTRGTYSVCKKVFANATTLLSGNDPLEVSIGVNNSFAGPSQTLRYEMLLLDVRTNFGGYTDDECEQVINSFSLGLPYYRTQVGVNPWLAPGDWDNGTGVRIEHKTIENASPSMTTLQWSDITGTTFPALNFLKLREPILAIISVPGFLKTEYQNTVIAFTRNTVTRLVLSNDLTSMASRVDNVVEEFPSGGLYAPRSLANTPYGIVWLAEEGVMVWNSKGFQNVSKGAIDLDHRGRPNDFVAAYFAAGGQYLLFDRNEESEICWVLHLDTMVWTRFSGFKFESTANLSLGSDYDNQMLLLTDDVVYAYPGTELTDQPAEIVTKRYYLDNIKPVRFRLAAEPMPDYVQVQTYNNEFATSLSISTVADIPLPGRLKWVMIPNGFWGEYLQLSIRNADELLRIDIDLKEGV